MKYNTIHQHLVCCSEGFSDVSSKFKVEYQLNYYKTSKTYKLCDKPFITKQYQNV